MKATIEHSKAAPASAISARFFDLTGKKITKMETTSFDQYSGHIDDLIEAGIVRRDQLPPAHTKSISWSNGRQVKSRIAIDASYVRVNIRDNAGNAWVGLGVSREVQQARKVAERARYGKWAEANPLAPQQSSNREKGLAEAKQAAKNLAEIPANQNVFLRQTARYMREMVLMVANIAASGSKNHGFRITSESLDNIHGALDTLTENFLNADVRFDAEHHAEAVKVAQRNVLYAAPFEYGRMSAFIAPNPSILQGEKA